jgi:hypothetical protein
MSGGGERQDRDRELRELFAALRRQEEEAGKARGAAELIAAARSGRHRAPLRERFPWRRRGARRPLPETGRRLGPAALRPRSLAAGLAALVLGVAGLFAAWLWLRGAAIEPRSRHQPVASTGSIATTDSSASISSIASIASVSSIAAWRPATDFLLRVPGREILAAVPSFGHVPSLGPAGRPPASDLTTRERERRIPR